MSDVTDTVADPATVLFNLPGYQVVNAWDGEAGREVLIERTEAGMCCPGCGVRSQRVHQRTVQRLRDIPVAGRLVVCWAKRRYRCGTSGCERVTFTEHTPQVPAYARSTSRLKDALVEAVATSGRSASETARAHRVGWWTVQRALSAASVRLADPAARPVRAIGIDEHRFHRVRFFRAEQGAWRRVEPWMSCVTDLDTGAVIGVFDGRDGAALRTWLALRPRWWRRRVQVAAIDLHARSAWCCAVGCRTRR